MNYDPDQITFFAQTDARGQRIPFGIKALDRTRHVYVIGKTGMGKSTLLENMAIQDIKNGNGLAFIDPHGQTAETLLNYIPEERKDDVLYFAPFDTDHPVSFNVMEDVGPDRRHLVVSGLMSVFKKIWVDAWSARMEYILSNTLLALLEYPDSTLLGVNRMLSDKVYRRKVIDNISDPAVKSFWVDEFLNYNERYMQEAGDAIKNKIGQFTSNPLIRNIIGQSKSSFDIRKMMDERKILIMNLSKGLVGESNANLLGSMLTTRIYLAAMSRADLSQEQMRAMPNFYFYVDEFQSFANATFADILSEARKYKLNLTIAHQYIEQMEEEVRNAVFGNVGTIISFRVGPFDAEILESIFTPKFTAPDIVNLGFAQIYLTLMIDGIGSQPFSATTLPPIDPPHISCRDMVIASSRYQFAHTRPEVEEMINKWHEPEEGSQHNNGGNGRNNNNKKQNNTNNNSGDGGNNKKQNSNNNGGNNKNGSNRSQNGNGRNANGNDHRKKENQQPPKNEKSVEDLRAILRNIVQKEGGSGVTKEKSPEMSSQKSGKEQRSSSKHEKHEKHEKQGKQKSNSASEKTDTSDRTDLSEVVAGVLKDASKIKDEQKKEQSTARQIPDTEIPQTQETKEPAQLKQQQSNKVSPDASPTSYAQVKNIDDPLSPKKLERMMRVTTSDKTPLK